MKKKGDNWKKFDELEKDILSVLNKDKKTISQIQLEIKTQASWMTIKNYLESLLGKKKVRHYILGRYTFWSKR